MQFTRTRYGLIAALLGIAALMLSGCGGDDGGLSAEDMARLAAAEEATAQAQAAAAAAQAEAATAHQEAEAAQAEAMMAHQEAEAATMEAEEAKLEAEAATMAAEEAIMDMEEEVPAGGAGLADLYEDLAGMAIEDALDALIEEEAGADGPISTTALEGAIRAVAEDYGLGKDAADEAVRYLKGKHSTYEVLQRAEADAIIMAMHDAGLLPATRDSAMMVLRGPQGPQGDTGDISDDVAMDLQDQIDDKADKPDPVLPPMPETAKVLTAGGLTLSSTAKNYDNDLLSDMNKQTGSKAEKGTYTAAAAPGFGGLNNLQASGDGAGVFGSWLEYSHWAVVMGEGDSGISTFSLGVPTGANPAPQDSDKLSARWKGTMTGAWNPTELTPVNGGDPTISAEHLQKADYTTVRGDAEIAVSFSSTGTGYKAEATLSIMNLVEADGDMLGNFRPGQIALGATVPTDSTADHLGYIDVWSGMDITKGDFARESISATTGGTPIPPPATGTVDQRDLAGSANYLAGRFYGTGGMEVGGVFMEDGQISGRVATANTADGFGTATAATGVGAAPVATTDDKVRDLPGTLVGAFGGGRVTPVTP